MKIGFFDSGLGGLTIMRAVSKALPQYDYVYYGDTANVPYGDRSEAEVYELTRTGVEHLFQAGAILVILACNSASVQTLRTLQDTYVPEHYPDRNVLGVVFPTAETVGELKLSRVHLIATKRTIDSGKYERVFCELGFTDIQCSGVATSELVPLIENGDVDEAVERAYEVLEPRVASSDGVILGCTHYTELTAGLRDRFAGKCRILSQDEIIPMKLESYLNMHPKIAGQLTSTGERTIHLTEHRPRYDAIMQQFLSGVLLED